MNFRSIRYITIKTQVRRLKYLSVALKYLSHEGLQKQMLNGLLLDWSKINSIAFEEYRSPSGKITLQQGKPGSNSLKAYYHALKEFSLIIEQGNFVLPTKKGEVITILHQHFQKIKNYKNENSFILDLTEKVYFLIILFEVDYDILVLILQIVHSYPNQRLESYLNHLQNFFLERLDNKLHFGKVNDIVDVLEVRKRVSSWRSPKRYSEELVPPRLNWLIDLELIDLDPKTAVYTLTANGTYFLNRIEESPVERKHFRYDEDFWSSSYIDIVAFMYFEESSLRAWRTLSDIEKESYTQEALLIASRYFCVLGIPRMPAKSTILLTSLHILNKHSVAVNFDELMNWLTPSRRLNGKIYGYRKAAREGEEYITVTNEQ